MQQFWCLQKGQWDRENFQHGELVHNIVDRDNNLETN